MNRLKKETFGNGDYISYEYDSSGNITQKIKYERTDAVLDEYTVLKRTVEKYTYAPEEGNRLQKVKFTVYNDKKKKKKDWVQASGEREYEYDGQGNYVGVTINTSNIGYKQTGYYCKWANGNRLTEVAVGTANKVRSRYTYNAEGIRVGKELIGFNSTTGEPIVLIAADKCSMCRTMTKAMVLISNVFLCAAVRRLCPTNLFYML